MGAPINRLESIWSRYAERELAADAEQPTSLQRAKFWETSLEGMLAKHPKAAIVAAAAVGIALGWIVKRK